MKETVRLTSDSVTNIRKKNDEFSVHQKKFGGIIRRFETDVEEARNSIQYLKNSTKVFIKIYFILSNGKESDEILEKWRKVALNKGRVKNVLGTRSGIIDRGGQSLLDKFFSKPGLGTR